MALQTIPPQGHLSRADIKADMYCGFSFSTEHLLRSEECVGHYVLISFVILIHLMASLLHIEKLCKSHESECEYRSVLLGIDFALVKII